MTGAYVVKDQDEISSFMTHKPVRWIDVYSSRERVNVIVPGTGYRGEGNHIFPPARGNVRAYIARCVETVIREESELYAANQRLPLDAYGVPFVNWQRGRGMNLPVGAKADQPYPTHERGHYTVTVWAPIVRTTQ